MRPMCGLMPWATRACRGAALLAALSGAGCQRRAEVSVTRAVHVAAGMSTTMAWRSDGRVFAFGANAHGELGVGDRAARSSPTPWTSVRDTIEVDLGWYWGCARTRTGAVWCWGDRSAPSGPTLPPARGPSLVRAMPPLVQMSMHEYAACGVSVDAHVYCWGVGIGAVSPGATAHTGDDGGVLVADVENAVGVDVGAGRACAWRGDGTAACWGQHSAGPSARESPWVRCDPELPGCFVAPRFVEGVDGITQMAVAAARTYAVTRTGELFVWRELRGEMANPAPLLVRVPGGTAQVEAGFNTDCARSRAGRVYCWGGGPITGTREAPLPRLVEGLDGVIDLAVGDEHACAVRRDATLWCWGTNREGELGHSPLAGSNWRWVPRRLPEIEAGWGLGG